jgi:hypothetical protein
MKPTLAEAIVTLQNAVGGTGVDVNIDDETISLHWFGVIEMHATTSTNAAAAIKLFKQLEALGAKDC